MPLRRSAAPKVMVFQCPCGTRPIRRSPRGQRPLSRTILVLAAVSSTKTSRAGSNVPCSRIQCRRARATSARSCSAARRLFFESNLVRSEEHTSELQSLTNLVCRLLLEKKNNAIEIRLHYHDTWYILKFIVIYF